MIQPSTVVPVEVRLRSRIPAEELNQKIGKIITPDDFNILLHGPARVLKPDGSTLCVYLPGSVPEPLLGEAGEILRGIREVSKNRGKATGAKTERIGNTTYSKTVRSAILGNFEPAGSRFPYCRQTAWTGQHAREFQALYPYFQYVSRLFKQWEPERYWIQKQRANDTHQAWIIPGTPYTTVTVNNTYPTGVHRDAGDLDEGFSCLSVCRYGHYTGGILTFPEWRVGVDMRHGDTILMNAHDWHGNTEIVTDDPLTNFIASSTAADFVCKERAERISTVLYFRTDMVRCGTPEQEHTKAKQLRGALK